MNWINDLINYFTRLFQWWVIILPWERGLRVRLGKRVKLLTPGVFFKAPFIDTVYCQTTRLRIVTQAAQTVSTLDKQTITLSAAVGYTITDIEKLFYTLYHPEASICNICYGEISEYISQHNLSDCIPSKIQEVVLSKLKTTDYGLDFEYFKLVSFANVRTYRIIQDQFWMNGFELNEKK